MSWLLIVIPLLAILFLLPPLFRSGRDEAADRESRIETLNEKRHGLIAAIRELDFDRQMGKLSEEDHGTQREKMKREVVETIRRIEREEGRKRG